MKSLIRLNNKANKLSTLRIISTRSFHSSFIQQDGLTTLENDHNKVRDLFSQLKQTNTLQQKEQLMEEIIKSLSRHTSAEERYLYPLINDYFDDGKLLYDKNLQDEQINKEMLQFFESHRWGKLKTSLDSDIYDREVNKFFQHLDEHMRGEEEILFPRLRDKMSKADLDSLGKSLDTAKMMGPTHPHPNAPNTPGMAKMTHPLSGMMDQAMDKVTGR
ncbi:hypothetical protein ABK040_002513 [Willaertia magna]